MSTTACGPHPPETKPGEPPLDNRCEVHDSWWFAEQPRCMAAARLSEMESRPAATDTEIGVSVVWLRERLQNAAGSSYEAYMNDYSQGSIDRAVAHHAHVKREAETYLSAVLGYEVTLGARTR
jgi:hypothetical protein